MGVGAGIFKMTNTVTKSVNSANPTAQEISLAEAYAQSAAQDKLIAACFDSSLQDGLIEKITLERPMDASSSKTSFNI